MMTNGSRKLQSKHFRVSDDIKTLTSYGSFKKPIAKTKFKRNELQRL